MDTLKEYPWKPEYSMGVDIVDKHHKRFVELINALLNIINKESCNTDISLIFHKLIVYAESYFFDKAMYFKKYNFPQSENHKQEHEIFLQKIIEFRKAYNSDNYKNLCRVMVNFMINWFENHLMVNDKEAAQYFVDKGIL